MAESGNCRETSEILLDAPVVFANIIFHKISNLLLNVRGLVSDRNLFIVSKTQ
jgi:hypothetical protein